MSFTPITLQQARDRSGQIIDSLKVLIPELQVQEGPNISTVVHNPKTNSSVCLLALYDPTRDRCCGWKLELNMTFLINELNKPR